MHTHETLHTHEHMHTKQCTLWQHYPTLDSYMHVSHLKVNMARQIRLDIICIKGAEINQTIPLTPSSDYSIWIIELTLMHDKYTNQAIKSKHDQYNPFMNTWVRGVFHISNFKTLKSLHLPRSSIIKKKATWNTYTNSHKTPHIHIIRHYWNYDHTLYSRRPLAKRDHSFNLSNKPK